MRLSVVTSLLCFARWQACANDGTELMRRTTNTINPISVPPSQNLDGDDGPWYSFSIQVGTPPQVVRVFISTASPDTIVVLPNGCSPEVLVNDPTCVQDRGVTFDNSSSSTWNVTGTYGLGLEDNLDLDTGGIFANDTITLGIDGSGGPTLENQIVSGIVSGTYWLGQFGVNPQPTNYTALGDSQASYMSTLKEQNLIPSVSFGYTAGAPYREKGVPGSLILGGYDLNRFVPNNISFTFAPDSSRDIVVGIQSITSVDQNGTSHNLLPSGGILSYIDTTVPFIYLPLDACRAFEDAFGLIYDNTSQLYEVSSSLHTDLLQQNASVTFAIGNSENGGPTVNITLPYDSFDLQAKWPLVQNATKYFPLKRAVNETQYTLGRTFMQEAYLTVDWERSNFSVSQCVFSEVLTQQLVAIQSYNSTVNSTTPAGTTGGSDTPKSSSNKAIGIGVGVAVALLVLVSGSACFFILKKRRTRRESKETDTVTPPVSNDDNQADLVRNGFAKAELGADGEHVRSELAGPGVLKLGDRPYLFYGEHNPDGLPHEVKGPEVAELGDAALRNEMLASSVAPVELPGHSSVELPGSTPLETNPSSMASSPILRSLNRSPINRSTGPSPLYRPVGSPSPVHQSSRPPFTNRMSSMDSLASSAPSLPGQPSGNTKAMQSAVATSLVGNDGSSPISPIAEGTLGHSGITSLLRGMDSSNPQSY